MSNKVSYITIQSFYGDPALRQLAFPQGAELRVSRNRQPQNGWLWGAYNGQEGWCPIWAVNFQPPPLAIPQVQQPQTHAVEGGGNRARLSPLIESPVGSERAAERKRLPEVFQESQLASAGVATQSQSPHDDDESTGFDISKGIMGGQIRRAEGEIPKDKSTNKGGAVSNEEIESKRSRRFLGRFRKPQVQPSFPKKAREPEWTATPQIIYEGKVIQEYSEKKKGFFQLPTIQSVPR